MPDINVVNEVVTQTPDIKKVDTPKPEHATSEPAAKPEKSQKGIKVSDALAVNDISNQDTLDQETTLDYEDAQLATSFEALNYNQSKSLADTWKFISDDITERLPVQSGYAQGVDTGELLNLYNTKETSTLKNLTAGFVEAPAQTAKVIDSLLIWGGALTSKLGVKTLGERMMQFGASNISNIDYMLKEYGFQDVNRESISYGVGGTISDILTSIGAAGMLSKASAKYTTKAMAKESAALAAKEAEGEVAKISLKKTLTSPEALKLYQHAERLNKWSRRAPFAFMMGKDIGSMLLSREEQYMNKDAGFMETDKFMDNFWKETTAVGTYGTISGLIEAYFGLGPILKGVPKGSELTLQALREAGKDLKWLPFAAKNHIGATFIGLSTLKEGITEALQEGTQSLTEMVFGLETKQEDGTLVYVPKQFKQELQRILIAGAIGGVVGGGMSFGHVQIAKSQFVELTQNAYKETHKDYTEGDIKKVTEEAKKTFNQVYGEVANTLSQELNTQQDITTMQGSEFVELFDHVHKQLLGLEEKGVKALQGSSREDVMNYTSQVANAMSKLLISKGVPVSDFKDHLKLNIEDYNGVVGVTAFWDTTPIFRPQELVINPNERYEEEKKLLSQYTKVTPKDAMYAELKTKLKGDSKTVNIWVDNNTKDVVTEPTLLAKLNTAQETISLNKIPDIIVKDAQKVDIDSVRGAFAKSTGTLFLNPKVMDATTLPHELGHLYAENMYMLYKSGKLSATEAKDFGTFLEALGVDTSLPHLTTKDSERIADVFSVVSVNADILGEVNKTLSDKEVTKTISKVADGFKQSSIKAFQTVNKKGMQITPAVKKYVQDVLGIKPKDILATVDTKGIKEDIINNLPNSHEDYNDMAKAIQEDSVVNLDVEPATIVKDATLDTLIKTGDMQGIAKVVKDNLNVNSQEGCVESLADNLNNIVMQRIQDISATTGKTVQEVMQEAKQDDMLFQKLLPTLEEIKTIKDMITNKEYGTLSLWDVASSIRYGSMLGSVSTFILSSVSNTMNTAIAKITDILTGRFKGVTNTVSETTMETVNKAHTERWKKAGLPNAYSSVTPAELAKKTAKKAATYKGKGEDILNLANKIGNWASMVTTALPDHITKTYYSNYVASMTASKIAAEKGLNANDIMLDSVLDNPLTIEGQEVRNAAQDAMRDVEFIPSGDGHTIGEKTVQFFNKGLDGALSVIENEDVRGFVKSAILPFNGIASGIAARTINGMIGLPYEGIYGMVQAFKEGDVSVFIDHVKSIDRRYYIDSIAALIVAGALEGLLDDEDYMPTYDLATYAQRQAAKRLGIPFDSIRIGDTWISTEYCGLLHTAVKLLPTLRKIRGGKLNEAWGEFSKNLATTALEAPVIGLGTDGVKNVVEGIKDPVTGLTNYLNSYVPRMVTATSKVISQEDNYYNPLTGTNESLQPYMQFIFGSRARLYTKEQADALNVVSKGINVVPGVKKDMTEKEQQKYAKEYSKRYKKLIHSPALKRMDAEEIKKAFMSIKKQATKASGYKKKKGE